jgi:hypothetical protein
MPKAPEEIELDQAWIGAEDLPVQFANAFTGVSGPNAIFLNIGSQVPPQLTTEDDVERLRAKGYVEVRPIARLALAPGGLDELIEALKNVRTNHRKLIKALEEEQS